MKNESWFGILAVVVLVIVIGIIGMRSVGNVVEGNPGDLLRGDLNKDKIVGEEDINVLVDYIFKGGAAPSPIEIGDVNADSKIDITDVTYLISYLYPQGAAPVSIQVGDVNLDNVLDDNDVWFLVEYIFHGGSAPKPVVVGDVNKDNVINLGDLVSLISYIHPSGPTPVPLRTGDLNKDRKVDQADVDFLAAYIFSGGSAPTPIESADVNNDNEISSGDLVSLTQYVNSGIGTLTLKSTGDLNDDNNINQADIDVLINYLFQGGSIPKTYTADVNGDYEINIADVSYLISYLYPTKPASFGVIARGDVNSDGFINRADIEFLINYLFQGGASPTPVEIADVNADKSIDIGDVVYLVSYLYPQGPVPIPFGGSADCTDSDGGINYYIKGATSGVSDDGIWNRVDYCDGGKVTEYNCNENNPQDGAGFDCPNGCVDGACKNDVNVQNGFNCQPIVSGGPAIQPQTRLNINNVLSYCDPFTLQYKSTKASEAACINDYECDSNVCIEGQCTLLKQQLKEQTSILKKIWCAMSHPIDFTKRESILEDNSYLDCVGAEDQISTIQNSGAANQGSSKGNPYGLS